MKEKFRRYQRKEVKHFTAKFLITLIAGLVSAFIPVYIYGGDAIMLSMAAGLAVSSLFMLIFGLVKE